MSNLVDFATFDADYLLDESTAVSRLLANWDLPADFFRSIQLRAEFYINEVRHDSSTRKGINAFLLEYDLSSKEGVVLLCLAEALLRIPDTETADRFIQDQLSQANWRSHLQQSDSLFVNAGTWGLMLTGKIIQDNSESELVTVTNQLMKRVTTPIFRSALREAMRFLGQQFIMGASLDQAIARRNKSDKYEYLYSYDMLGEAAITTEDANRYFELYQYAIDTLGQQHSEKAWKQRDSISIKLSALHPRFEISQRERVIQELIPRLLRLIEAAKHHGIGVTIDAEEASRLSLSLYVYRQILLSFKDDEWDGFGIVIQSYQKRAVALIELLQQLSLMTGKKIPVRLVKGAYWDSEIKSAQEMGLADFPVFTRKCHSDMSYLVCAKHLLSAQDHFYPQFATHNPLSLSAVIMLADHYHCSDYEVQRLHGMGESLYHSVLNKQAIPCRVYAPVGGHKDLLPYLVRRLLENGANTSFVNRISDSTVAVDELLANPFVEAQRYAGSAHPKIKLSRELFLPNRVNSSGINFDSEIDTQVLLRELSEYANTQWSARPLLANYSQEDKSPVSVESIGITKRVLGNIIWADEQTMDQALLNADEAKPIWMSTPLPQRLACLITLADLIEAHRPELCYLLCHEAGRTLKDAVAETREAVDFCRYYAQQASEILSAATEFSGPTGESNCLNWHPRGVFVCISPWNFPLAIFTGQIVAALVMGNTVIAKPASAAVLIGARLVELCYQAGIPRSVLSYLPSTSDLFMSKILTNQVVAGVAFTGSTTTATIINRCLADRSGALTQLIAETGGINSMIVDSSALVEQVAVDVVSSAFNSAGQRCSALRVLYVQQDIAPRLIELIIGVIKNSKIGDSSLLDTDIGPLISVAAASTVNQHVEAMTASGNLIYQQPLPDACRTGSYVGPAIIEIEHLDQLKQEVFGPVLHVIRYSADKLHAVLQQINQSHYGLTLGIHSRIESTVDYIVANVRVGNIYINRNMIGAVVGVQPFGGEGLSGTGPKAGGPSYLYAYAVERLVTKNTAAIGGNATLLSMLENEQ